MASPDQDLVALVPAAGIGERLGLGPKAFLEANGETLLSRTVRTLREVAARVVVAVPPSCMERARAEMTCHAEVITGGPSRHESVRRMLEGSTEKFVLVHDVTRPFASAELCRRVVRAAREHGAAGAFVRAIVGAGLGAGDFILSSISSSELRLPQSPHCYRREVLELAYRAASEQGVETQSNWELVLRFGQTIREVPGEPRNLKITLPFDWEVARAVVLPALATDADR